MTCMEEKQVCYSSFTNTIRDINNVTMKPFLDPIDVPELTAKEIMQFFKVANLCSEQ
jgi:hypothetical protein